MSLPRSFTHPGKPFAERYVLREGRAVSFETQLQAGLTINEAVARAAGLFNLGGGGMSIAGGAFGPFTYVMPALSPDDSHVAWYSDQFTPPGRSAVEHGAVTFGLRDGAPFLHCHAIWTESGGRRTGGHVMPNDTIICEPIAATVHGVREACIKALPDPETNFTIFHPADREDAPPAGADGPRAVLVRLRPNVEIHAALEEIAARQGFRRAIVRGGVGSLIGVIFDDGRVVENFATEIFITRGVVDRSSDGGLVATIDVGLVDYKGGLYEGRLRRGENPVLITFELMLEEIEG